MCVCKRVYYFLITANFALCFIISILRLLCLSSAVSRRFSDAVRDAAGRAEAASAPTSTTTAKKKANDTLELVYRGTQANRFIYFGRT